MWSYKLVGDTPCGVQQISDENDLPRSSYGGRGAFYFTLLSSQILI